MRFHYRSRSLIAAALLPLLTHCSTAPDATSNRTTPAPAAGANPVTPPAAANANAVAASANQVRDASLPKIDFAAQINPILQSSCGTNSCHGTGAPQTAFVDNQAGFDADAAQILTRISSTTTTVMPPVGYPEILTPPDALTLTQYLQGLGATAAGAPGAAPGSSPGAVAGGPAGPIPVFTVTKACAAVTAADKAVGLAMTFDQITGVVTRDCGGANCHQGGAGFHNFVGVQAAFLDRNEAAGMVGNVKSGVMPQGKGMSPEDKAALIDYVCGRFDI